jgi:integrase
MSDTPQGRKGERVPLTESEVANLEKWLTKRGRDLGKAQDVWDDELRGLLMRREASGSKGWHLRIQVNGRRSKVKLGTWPAVSCAKARKAAMVAAANVARGEDPIALRREQRKAAKARREQTKRAAAAVLGTFVEGDYKAWAEKHLRSHKATLSALKADFEDWWSRPMDSLTVLDVERWRQAALKSGNQKSTANRAWQRLRAVLGKAHEWGLMGPPPKVRRFKLDTRGRVRFLTPEERARLMAALDDREQRRREERTRMIDWQRERNYVELPEHGTFTDHIRPLVVLVLNTGLRRGEALGLTWGAVDFANGLVHVDATTSKSGKGRDIPMTAEARETLLALRDQHFPDGKTEPDAFLFNIGGGRLATIGHRLWGELMSAAHIKNFRFHDLRHDFASRLVMAKVDLYSVSKLLGHGDIQMTQRYAHLAPDYLRAAVSKLDGAAQAA